MLYDDGSGDEAEFFTELYGLRATLGAQFIEDAAGVRLDGVFTHEEFFGDFAVAQALGDEFKYLQFARGNAKCFALAIVRLKWLAGGYGDFFYDDTLLGAGQLQPKPNPKDCEGGCDQPTVDFDRMLNDEEAIFGPFESCDEDAAD